MTYPFLNSNGATVEVYVYYGTRSYFNMPQN